MLKLTPLLAALLAAGMLQGCATAPAPQAAARAAAPARGADTYYRLGKHLQERGELELAQAAFSMSIELDKGQLEARNAAAALHARQGRLDQAAALLRQLVEDFPGAARPYNNLGYVYYLQGDYAGAAATLRQALLLDGQNDLAKSNLKLAEAALAAAPGAPAPAVAAPPEPALAAAPAAAAPPMAAPAAVAAVAPELPAAAEQPAPRPAPKPMPVLALLPAAAPQPPLAPLPAVATLPVVTQMPTVVVGAAPAGAGAAAAPEAPAAPGRVELVQLQANVYQLKFNDVAAAPLAVLPAAPLPAAERPPKAPAAPATRLEIANGNGVNGMAKRIRRVLAQLGIPVRRLSNERPYTQRLTTIQYRPGFEREAAQLQRALKGDVALLPAKGLAAGSDLRLVLGRDGAAQLARFEAAAGFPLLAMNDTGN